MIWRSAGRFVSSLLFSCGLLALQNTAGAQVAFQQRSIAEQQAQELQRQQLLLQQRQAEQLAEQKKQQSMQRLLEQQRRARSTLAAPSVQSMQHNLSRSLTNVEAGAAALRQQLISKGVPATDIEKTVGAYYQGMGASAPAPRNSPGPISPHAIQPSIATSVSAKPPVAIQLQTFNYEDRSVQLRSVKAVSANEAIRIAPNIAPTSGVQAVGPKDTKQPDVIRPIAIGSSPLAAKSPIVNTGPAVAPITQTQPFSVLPISGGISVSPRTAAAANSMRPSINPTTQFYGSPFTGAPLGLPVTVGTRPRMDQESRSPIRVISNTANQFQESTVGSVMINAGAAAGGALAPGRLSYLGIAGDASAIASAYTSGGKTALAEEVFVQGFVWAAEKAGWTFGPHGAALAAATAQASFDIGKNYIAPLVAPTLADWMFRADQRFLGGKLFAEGRVFTSSDFGSFK
jgi:hypothetical protein